MRSRRLSRLADKALLQLDDNLMQNANSTRLPDYGEEVVIHCPGHQKHNEIGVYVGLNYASLKPRARVRIDGDIYLCDPADLVEN